MFKSGTGKNRFRNRNPFGNAGSRCPETVDFGFNIGSCIQFGCNRRIRVSGLLSFFTSAENEGGGFNPLPTRNIEKTIKK